MNNSFISYDTEGKAIMSKKSREKRTRKLKKIQKKKNAPKKTKSVLTSLPSEPDLTIENLCSLLCMKENHPNTFMLEMAISDYLGDSSKLTSMKNVIEICDFLNNSCGYNREFIDPTESLFTEEITWKSGYTVYNGISTYSAFEVSSLLSAFTLLAKKHHFTELQQTENICKLLLILCDSIASQYNHKRNIKAPQTSDKIVPPKIDSLQYINPIRFDRKELFDYLDNHNINSDEFNRLIPSSEDIKLWSRNKDPEKNPILTHPLIPTGKNSFALVVTTIHDTLVSLIGKVSTKANLYHELLGYFRNILMSRCLIYIRNSDNLPLKIPHKCAYSENTEEIHFQFDSDKICVLSIETNHNSERKEYCFDSTHDESERKTKIAEYYSANNNCSVFFINSFSRIASITKIFSADNKNGCELNITISDLFILLGEVKGEILSLWKFASASRPPLVTFSTLDLYEIYKQHKNSFYLTDDTQPSFLNIASGTGLETRANFIVNNDYHMQIAPNGYVALIAKRHPENCDNIYFDVQEALQKREIFSCIEGWEYPLWITSTRLGNDEFWPHHVTKAILNAIVDIINSIRKFCGICHDKKEKQQNIIWFQIVFIGTITNKDNDNIEEIDIDIGHKNAQLKINPSYRVLLETNDKMANDILVKKASEIFFEYIQKFNIHQDIHWQEVNKEFADSIKNNKYQLLLNFYNMKNVRLNPVDLQKTRRVYDHDSENILNNLTEKIRGKIKKEKPNESDYPKAMVEYFIDKLNELLSEYSAELLLEYCITQYEGIVHKQATNKYIVSYANSIFNNNPNWLDEYPVKERELINYAISLRCLIEKIAANPSSSTKTASIAIFDRLIAYSHGIIQYGFVSDMVHLKLADDKFCFLASGRIGRSQTTMDARMESFSTTLMNMELDKWGGSPHPNHNDIKLDELNEIEQAIESELGIAWSPLINTFLGLIAIGVKNGTSCTKMPLDELISNLEKIQCLASEQILSSINAISIRPRANWLQSPNTQVKDHHTWPWRYNRKYSYIQRPIIIIPKNGTDVCFWGFRHVDLAMSNLYSLIESARYPASSKELKALLGKISNTNGENFQKAVREWAEEQFSYVMSEVPIKPDGFFESDTDLGDIDLLILDAINDTIYSLECKNTVIGRTPRELRNEIDKYSEGEKSYIEKHLLRHNWLQDNIDHVCKKLDISKGKWNIKSAIINSNELAFTYVKSPTIPVTTLKCLIDGGRDCLAILFET